MERPLPEPGGRAYGGGFPRRGTGEEGAGFVPEGLPYPRAKRLCPHRLPHGSRREGVFPRGQSQPSACLWRGLRGVRGKGRNLLRVTRAANPEPRLDPTMGVKAKARPEAIRSGFDNTPGNALLSHKVSLAVPSALEGLTSVFGMGTGVAPPLMPPGISIEYLACRAVAPKERKPAL